MDFLRPQPVVDLQTGEGQDPRLKALEELMRQNQSGQVIDPFAMMQQKKLQQELPPEYIPQQKYRGPEIPPDNLPTGPVDPYEVENRRRENEDYLRTLPPHVGDRFRAMNNGEGPQTDSEYDAVYGKGATERSMSGGDIPLYDRGFAKGLNPQEFPRRRRKNMPSSERFHEETMGSGEYIGDNRD